MNIYIYICIYTFYNFSFDGGLGTRCPDVPGMVKKWKDLYKECVQSIYGRIGMAKLKERTQANGIKRGPACDSATCAICELHLFAKAEV